MYGDADAHAQQNGVDDDPVGAGEGGRHAFGCDRRATSTLLEEDPELVPSQAALPFSTEASPASLARTSRALSSSISRNSSTASVRKSSSASPVARKVRAPIASTARRAASSPPRPGTRGARASRWTARCSLASLRWLGDLDARDPCLCDPASRRVCLCRVRAWFGADPTRGDCLAPSVERPQIAGCSS